MREKKMEKEEKQHEKHVILFSMYWSLTNEAIEMIITDPFLSAKAMS